MAENEPSWAIILHILYENQLAGRTFTDYGYTGLSRQIAIAEETNLEIAEVTRVVSQMVEQGLITDVDPNRLNEGYMLTETGFDVAHTRDLRRQEKRREQQRDKRQHGVNRAIGYLTLGLVLTGVLQMTIAALLGIGSLSFSITDIALSISLVHVLLVGYSVVLGLGVLLWKSGMLAAWKNE